jgi:hypothetical protein
MFIKNNFIAQDKKYVPCAECKLLYLARNILWWFRVRRNSFTFNLFILYFTCCEIFENQHRKLTREASHFLCLPCNLNKLHSHNTSSLNCFQNAHTNRLKRFMAALNDVMMQKYCSIPQF